MSLSSNIFHLLILPCCTKLSWQSTHNQSYKHQNLTVPSSVTFPKLLQRSWVTTFSVSHKNLKISVAKPFSTEQTFGTTSENSTSTFFSVITVFLCSILFQLLFKVPPGLLVILIPPLASSHTKFRLLSFTF